MYGIPIIIPSNPLLRVLVSRWTVTLALLLPCFAARRAFGFCKSCYRAGDILIFQLKAW
jgi:hypothetical protein